MTRVAAGPVVVITGASSGIGEAIARELARQGCRLVLAARRVERLEALAASLGPDVLCVATDVTADGALTELAAAAAARFGHIDVWVNNAGIGLQGRRWWEQDVADIDQVLNTNLRAVVLGVQAALPGMLERGRGHFIQIGSVAGLVGSSGVYSATKFGVTGFNDALRRELRGRGIHVSLVAPGFIATEMTERLRMRMPGPEIVARAVARLIQRPRRLVIVPWWYRLAVWLERLSPALVDWFFSKQPMKL